MRRHKENGRGRMKNATARRDAALKEFEIKDLGDEIASGGTAVVLRPRRPTSVLPSDEPREALRRRRHGKSRRRR